MACAYCGAASLHAVRAHQAKSQEALAQDEAQLKADQAALNRGAVVALIWSLVGVFLCCVPIPGIVAIVLGHRVRTRTQARGWAPNATSTLAMVFGGVNIAAFLGFAVLVANEMQTLSQRKSELHAALGEATDAAVLSQQTACQLAELRLLEDGWDKHSGNATLVETFECAGRLEQSADRAVLHGLTFRFASERRFTLDACLRRGQRWRLDRLVLADAGCEDATPAP